MEGAEELRGATFSGHLAPPGGPRCELIYRFREPLTEIPSVVRAQRRSLGWAPAAPGVSCVAASCSIPALGLDKEEVVVSVDPAAPDGSRRLLLQSPARPDLGVTVLTLAPDGQSLCGGDESWAPADPPVVTATRRGAGSAPSSPTAAAVAGKAAAPPAKPPAAPGRAPAAPASLAATPVRPPQPAPAGSRRPAPRASFSPARRPSVLAEGGDSLASGAGGAEEAGAAFGRLGLAAADPAEAGGGDAFDGLDAVVGGEGAGRPLPGGFAGRGGEADAARRLAAAAAARPTSGGRSAAGGALGFQRPDLMTGETKAGAEIAAPPPGALDQEIRRAEAEAVERLVAAAEAGEEGDVRLMLARVGADRAPSEGRQQGLTALMAAAARGRTGVVELLTERRAGLEVRDPSGWTALMHAIQGQRPECVRALLEARAAVHTAAEADMQRTPLMLAAAGPRPELCATLLRAGARPEARDQEGLRALHYSAKKGNGGALVCLLNARAKTSEGDAVGMTPLHLAAAAGRAEAVKILLAHRASAAEQDFEGRTAAQIAKTYDHDRVLRVLDDARN